METRTKVEITMRDLHKYIKDWQVANREQDAAAALHQALRERWPDQSTGDVLVQAEINALRADRSDAAKRALADPEKWISTCVQSDLFHDWDMLVPPRFIIDGEVVDYWKVSPVAQLSFFEARDAALRMEIDALTGAADQKRRHHDRVKSALNRTIALIQAAREQGVDPESLRYARQA